MHDNIKNDDNTYTCINMLDRRPCLELLIQNYNIVGYDIDQWDLRGDVHLQIKWCS
jgi:hypothetical protein